jgi:hypothetical protein
MVTLQVSQFQLGYLDAARKRRELVRSGLCEKMRAAMGEAEFVAAVDKRITYWTQLLSAQDEEALFRQAQELPEFDTATGEYVE